MAHRCVSWIEENPGSSQSCHELAALTRAVGEASVGPGAAAASPMCPNQPLGSMSSRVTVRQVVQMGAEAWPARPGSNGTHPAEGCSLSELSTHHNRCRLPAIAPPSCRAAGGERVEEYQAVREGDRLLESLPAFPDTLPRWTHASLTGAMRNGEDSAWMGSHSQAISQPDFPNFSAKCEIALYKETFVEPDDSGFVGFYSQKNRTSPKSGLPWMKRQVS